MSATAAPRPPHEPRASAVSDDLDAHYQILGPLGSSLTGRSFLARHRDLGRLVIVKLMHDGNLSRSSRVPLRFEREARALSQVAHAHVAGLLGYGRTADGRRYMIVEHVDGRDLRATLQRWGRLPERRALRILDQLAQALAAVHSAGLVHRNLKPESVLIGQSRDGLEHVKLTNFGLVRSDEPRADGERTHTGPMHGTPRYWSPEQVLGVPVDQRSDIYAFGVLAYELLTGSTPFESTTTEGFAWQHVSVEPPRPIDADGRPRLRPELELLLARCLAKDPAQRFATMHEVRRALVKLRRRPVARATPSLGQRLAARARQPETWLVIAGSFMAGLFGALLGR